LHYQKFFVSIRGEGDCLDMEDDDSTKNFLTKEETGRILDERIRRLDSLQATRDRLLRTKPTDGSISLKLWSRLLSRNEDIIKAIESEIHVLSKNLQVLSE